MKVPVFKWQVEVWEHRRVSFEVEAENEKEAETVAVDAYGNSDRLQDLMLDDRAIASSDVKVLRCSGKADGIVCTDPESEGIAKVNDGT
jgi:hypothetical protein